MLAGVDRTSCSYSGDSWYSSIISSLMFSLFSVFVFSLNDFAPFNECGFPDFVRLPSCFAPTFDSMQDLANALCSP